MIPGAIRHQAAQSLPAGTDIERTDFLLPADFACLLA